MSDDTYKVEVLCKNCGFEGEIEIEKGVKIEDHPCPNCGNRDLIRKLKPIRMIPKIENYE